MAQVKTIQMQDMLSGCDNIEDFKAEILPKLSSQKKLWQEKINEIMTENGYSQGALAELCQVSRATVLKWTRGSLPHSRDLFIRIGFAAKYDLDEMNYFLKRFGRYPELYAKSLEDSIYMFVLNSKEIDHTYSACETVFRRVDLKLNGEQTKPEEKKKMQTQTVVDYLLSISAIDELKAFIQENMDIYRSAYDDFYEYVIGFVRENNDSYIENEKVDDINSLANTLEWSSSLRKCVYSIYRKEWFPFRNKVISLGIHLNMNVDQINEMLRLAKMEPLYVNNPLENILVFAINDADLSDCIYAGTDDLYVHVMEILDQLEIQDTDYDLEEVLN